MCPLHYISTVAHRGKTQLNFISETQQSFSEHNNLLQHTTIFLRTRQSFSEHNNLFQNTKIFFRTQQSFAAHNNLFENMTTNFRRHFFQNATQFSGSQQQTRTTKFRETQQSFKVLVTSPDAESDWNLGLLQVTFPLPACMTCPPYFATVVVGAEVKIISFAPSARLVYHHLQLVKCLLLKTFEAKSRKKGEPRSSPSPRRWKNL